MFPFPYLFILKDSVAIDIALIINVEREVPKMSASKAGDVGGGRV